MRSGSSTLPYVMYKSNTSSASISEHGASAYPMSAMPPRKSASKTNDLSSETTSSAASGALPSSVNNSSVENLTENSKLVEKSSHSVMYDKQHFIAIFFIFDIDQTYLRAKISALTCYKLTPFHFFSCCNMFWRLCCRRKELTSRTVFIGRESSQKFPPNVIRNQKYSIITFIPVVRLSRYDNKVRNS